MIKIKGKNGVVYGINDSKFSELISSGDIFKVSCLLRDNKLRERIVKHTQDINCISYGLLRNKLRCSEKDFKFQIDRLEKDGYLKLIERKNKYNKNPYFDIVIN